MEEDEFVVLYRNAHVWVNNHSHSKAFVLLNNVSRGDGSFRCPSDQCPLYHNYGTLTRMENRDKPSLYMTTPIQLFYIEWYL